MSNIVLSAGVRANLLQLQQTSDLITQTENRLATGKKVNSALDNAISFFTAQGLDNRANDLSGLLDSMSNGVNTIQAANNGITSITKLVQSAQALVSQAQQANNTTTQAALATQFNSLVTQIGQLAGDSGFNGVNLLGGNTLTVTLNESGSSTIAVTGVNYTNAQAHAAEHRQRGQQLGRRRGHHCGVDSSERRAHLVAVGVPDAERQFGDRADPSGLHQVDDQHAADRFCQPYAGRQQPGRRQPACVADPPATVVHRVVSRFAGRPERAAAVPLSRAIIPIKTAAFGPPFFYVQTQAN